MFGKQIHLHNFCCKLIGTCFFCWVSSTVFNSAFRVCTIINQSFQPSVLHRVSGWTRRLSPINNIMPFRNELGRNKTPLLLLLYNHHILRAVPLINKAAFNGGCGYASDHGLTTTETISCENHHSSSHSSPPLLLSTVVSFLN